MDKVSVIVPVYNAEKYLRRCLDSIMNQTYKDIQVVVINDGSKDNSDEVIKSYTNNRFEIKYIYQQNQGPSVARNRGIDESEGEFISFVDADDYLEMNAIEIMMMQQRKLDADIVIANHLRHEKDKQVSYSVDLPEILDTNEGLEALFRKKVRVGCYGKIYRIKALKRNGLYFPTDRYGEDVYHLYKCMISNLKIAWLDKVVYHVVDTEGSICNSYNYKFVYMMDTLSEIQDELIEEGLWKKHKASFEKYYASHLYFLINYGIRFNNEQFLNEVLDKNLYPKSQITLGNDKRIKVILDAVIFGMSKRLYIIIKKWKKSVRKKELKNGKIN